MSRKVFLKFVIIYGILCIFLFEIHIPIISKILQKNEKRIYFNGNCEKSNTGPGISGQNAYHVRVSGNHTLSVN